MGWSCVEVFGSFERFAHFFMRLNTFMATWGLKVFFAIFTVITFKQGLSSIERVQITVLSKPLKHWKAMDLLDRSLSKLCFWLKADLAKRVLVNAFVHRDELVFALVLTPCCCLLECLLSLTCSMRILAFGVSLIDRCLEISVWFECCHCMSPNKCVGLRLRIFLLHTFDLIFFVKSVPTRLFPLCRSKFSTF